MTDRYVKKWSGIPHPGTLAFVHMPEGLNIKSISSLYLECHTNAYISTREKGDPKVNHCLDSRLTREAEWSKKISHTVMSDNILKEVNEKNPSATLKQKQREAKEILKTDCSENWNSHVKSLVVQGRFLEILSEESRSYDWKSVIFNLPARVSKFMINSLTDTLNTRANLKRWGKCMTTKCRGCGNHETLHHVLNNCSTFLEQGRYTWRHNNILSFIHSFLKESISENDILNCDLGENERFTTVPLECSVTNLIPDICYLMTNEKELIVIELTVPFELNIENAHTRKTNKYSPLISDIESKGYKVKFIALEIGSRGYIDNENMKRLKSIYGLVNNNQISFKIFRDKIAKLSVLSSFVIYSARNDPSWDNFPTLSV